jgi:hypothetical protein
VTIPRWHLLHFFSLFVCWSRSSFATSSLSRLSSAPPIRTMTTEAEIENLHLEGILGPHAVGVMVAMFLFGFVTIQTSSYYRKYSDDRMGLKALVRTIYSSVASLNGLMQVGFTWCVHCRMQSCLTNSWFTIWQDPPVSVHYYHLVFPIREAGDRIWTSF